MEKEEFWSCPHCGAELKKGAKVCHNCGSDEETGWSDMTYLDGADWIHDEWKPEESKVQNSKMSIGTIVLIAVIIVAVILSALR